VLDSDGAILRWYDYALKGVRNEYATGAPVRLFTMGENAWRDEQEFPLARTRYTNYYLTKGALSDAPTASEPEQFEYDPANPVPTIGGAYVAAISASARPCRSAAE
jgi:putative CocE/NonD family hydrolase